MKNIKARYLKGMIVALIYILAIVVDVVSIMKVESSMVVNEFERPTTILIKYIHFLLE